MELHVPPGEQIPEHKSHEEAFRGSRPGDWSQNATVNVVGGDIGTLTKSSSWCPVKEQKCSFRLKDHGERTEIT